MTVDIEQGRLASAESATEHWLNGSMMTTSTTSACASASLSWTSTTVPCSSSSQCPGPFSMEDSESERRRQRSEIEERIRTRKPLTSFQAAELRKRFDVDPRSPSLAPPYSYETIFEFENATGYLLPPLLRAYLLYVSREITCFSEMNRLRVPLERPPRGSNTYRSEFARLERTEREMIVDVIDRFAGRYDVEVPTVFQGCVRLEPTVEKEGVFEGGMRSAGDLYLVVRGDDDVGQVLLRTDDFLYCGHVDDIISQGRVSRYVASVETLYASGRWKREREKREPTIKYGTPVYTRVVQ